MSEEPWMEEFLGALDRSKVQVQFWACRLEHPWPERELRETVRWRGGVAFCMWPGCGRMSQYKSNHQCRLCGFWFEGPWSRADRAGDLIEADRIQMEMNRGVCDPCVEELVKESGGHAPS